MMMMIGMIGSKGFRVFCLVVCFNKHKIKE